ncbi:GspE/PulE family protein [Synechococcus sp. N32]|uniref:GspE/PulE family protein n=1 Tax=Synechococcus sp. N32 TaxID=2575514 RepID=UPI001FCA7000|nr:ATPase, T2SS/T4P/T4SS family [Synechococcus sp. N32]
MTLTLPTPDAGDTARQRFALELLLQQPVPGPEQLLASRKLLSDALPEVSPNQWRALQAMPIAIGADHLDIAIPSQWRDQEWQHLIDQLPDQHRTIRLHPAIEADLQRALATARDQPTKEPNPPTAEQSSNPAPAKTASTLDLNAESFLHDFSPDEVLESEEDSDAQLARDAIDLETSLNDAEASPVVTLVDRILLQAMSVGASDIHVEPQKKGLRLRFRQDGVLQQYVEPLPSRLVPAVTSRFKILADLDIAERRQAQDGRIRRKYRDRVIDFRVNTLPSRFGEKVCLRQQVGGPGRCRRADRAQPRSDGDAAEAADVQTCAHQSEPRRQ